MEEVTGKNQPVVPSGGQGIGRADKPAAGAPAGAAYDPQIDGEFSFFDMISTVPAPVRDYLLSSQLDVKRKNIYDGLKLSDDDRDIALFTELEVFFGDLDLKDYPNALWSRLPWEDAEEGRAKKLVGEVMGRIFLPAQAFLGDVVGVMHGLGIDPASYPQEQLEVRVARYDDAAKSVADLLAAEGLDAKGRARLEHIIVSRLRDVRDDAETRNMLTKSGKTGGMELSEEQADRLMAALKDEMRMTKFVDEIPAGGAAAGDAAARPPISSEEIRRRLAGSPEEQKAVTIAVEKALNEAKGDAGVIRERLHDIIYRLTPDEPSEVDVVATVMALARLGGVIPALTDDKRFRDAVKMYAAENGLEDAVRDIEEQPTYPAAMNLFLQMVFRGFGGLNDEDSARYGLRVANIMKKAGDDRYSGLVAFDMDQDRFVWTEPVMS